MWRNRRLLRGSSNVNSASVFLLPLEAGWCHRVVGAWCCRVQTCVRRAPRGAPSCDRRSLCRPSRSAGTRGSASIYIGSQLSPVVSRAQLVVWTWCSIRPGGGERWRSSSALREWSGGHLRSGEKRARALRRRVVGNQPKECGDVKAVTWPAARKKF